ncbi:hypothetical protein P280DRAFT_539041 [Massarina eburnea CBS 473.64]|uniref:Uncharacterized protein n=1 Tax=Massarina eburnea CBS 473.64 TaxID=1395130 RepID=A0A6A6S7G9_9PLEO|nr:hypothetical protein P280DRAFT_539041 [Massarina eburnea CBS 473.64]
MDLMSEAEIKQKEMQLGSLLWDAFVKPWEMNLMDPTLLFRTVYLGLIYRIFYSFFQSFPLVCPVYYGFSATSTGLIFLVSVPPWIIAFTLQIPYLRYRVFPRLANSRKLPLAWGLGFPSHSCRPLHLRLDCSRIYALNGAYHWPLHSCVRHLSRVSGYLHVHSQYIPKVRGECLCPECVS